MAIPVENIVGNVVTDQLKEVVKKQKYPSARAFYTIGGSSLGVWLFNSTVAGMVEKFTGEANYTAYNCDAWLKLSALILALVVAFVGAEFLKLRTGYDRLVSFFTGLLIFFCATSLNSYTSHFFDTSKPTEAKNLQMGVLPFRNPSWFPPESLVKEVEIKDQQNQTLQKDSKQFAGLIEQTVEQIPACSTETSTQTEKKNVNTAAKSEILNNLASYKTALARSQQSSQFVSGKNDQIQKQNAADAETKGFNAIIRLDFNTALQSFQQAYEAWSVYHNVDEINKLLQSNNARFESNNEPKNILWQGIYCEIALKYQWGMPADIRSQFQQALKSNNYSCSQSP